MTTRILRFVLLATLSLACRFVLKAQVSTAGAGHMLTPPPVSGQSYRIETGMEERSNYIRGGVGAGAGYIDNLSPGSTTGQLGEKTINLQPSIQFDTRSARQHASALYSPNFTFYEPSSSLNQADHDASFTFQYRLNPRLNMDLSDMLVRSSTGFNQIGNGGISGSAQTSGIIVPFGSMFSNNASGGLSYQFSPHGMIGGSGNVGKLNYSGATQTAGLYNSNSHGGSGFYNHRLSAAQYLGGIYQYEQSIADSPVGQYETQTHTIDGFYTIYVSEAFSLSVSGGPQHYLGEHTSSPAAHAWTPSIAASMGWQSPHTSFAANFSRTVTGGGGLVGAFNSRSAGAMGRWQFSRMWNAGLDVNYWINKNATPLPGITSPGGHTFITSLTLARALSRRTRAALRYDRIQNRYGGISSIATNPSSDRIMLSFTWQFERPIGR